MAGCGNRQIIEPVTTLNSRYTEQSPSLSGNGRLLAFISNRRGRNEIFVYDVQSQRLIDLPGLDVRPVMTESPSLSMTGRYMVFLTTVDGTPEIALYDRVTQMTNVISRSYRNLLRNPHISPDGRYISFETARRGQWDIEILDRGPNIELDLPDGLIIEE
jgi:Tol biopolymer transport system component